MNEGMKVEMCILSVFCLCAQRDSRHCGVSWTLYIELQQWVHWYSARVRLFLLQSSLQSETETQQSAHTPSFPDTASTLCLELKKRKKEIVTNLHIFFSAVCGLLSIFYF